MKIMTLVSLVFSVNAFAVKATEGLPQIVAQTHELLNSQVCEIDWDFYSGPETYTLDKNNTLFLVPCLSGAYQTSSVAYVLQGEKSVSPLMVLSYDPQDKSVYPSAIMTNAAYDPETRTLSTFAKGRGIGDCGQSSVSKIKINYGEVSAKTTEIRDKMKCDGRDTVWPVVFKQ